MPMPNRTTTDNNYRYAFQGQEKDPETGMEAFELRLWDGRLGRWLTVDPYHEFFSPYVGMGNNPANLIDPDGGSTSGGCDPCPDPPVDGGSYSGEITISYSVKRKISSAIEHTAAFSYGLISALASNAVLGAFRINAPDNIEKQHTKGSFMIGQLFGDVASILIGKAESGLGEGMILTGALAEAPSAGTSTGVVIVGAAGVVHGESVAAIGTVRTVVDIINIANHFSKEGQAGNGGGGYKKPKPGLSGKEGAKNSPSWAKGEKPFKGENGKNFAKRLMDKKYGEGNYKTGPKSEYNQIQKWGDRSFE